jgi:cytoskeletal protein CcmA (bactofilin family)
MAEQEVFSLALKNGNPDPTKWPQLTSSTDNQLDLEGSLKLQPGVAVTKFSNDVALAGNSALALPTEQAVKTYVDTQIGQVNTALAMKASLAGATTQDFTTNNLTVQGNGNVVGALTVQKDGNIIGALTVQKDVKVQGNLEVTGTTTFRNIEQHQGDLELGDADTDQVRIHGMVRSTHSSGTLQVGSPMQVTGTIAANKFVGDGSGLTGLVGTTQWGNGAGGVISYNSGNVGIGAVNPGDKLEIATSGDSNNGLTIREPGDGSVSLNLKNSKGKWHISGPRSYESNNQLGIFWNNNASYLGPYLSIQDNGNVGVGTGSLAVKGDIQFGATLSTAGRMHITGGELLYLLHKDGALVSKAWGGNGNLTVEGDLTVGPNPIHFTSVWRGFPSVANNQAEIANDTSVYKTLMIVGNTSAGLGRRVSIWDRLEVNGQMSVSDGIIQKGGDPITSTADLGLYSQLPGYCMRFVTTGGGDFWFFSDGGGGTNIVAMIDANGKYTQRSSQKYKENIENLSSQAAFMALEELRPVQFNFKKDEQKRQHIGFIAEELPELVATPDREMLSSTDIIAVLTQVVKDQQSTILELKQRVCALEHQHSA